MNRQYIKSLFFGFLLSLIAINADSKNSDLNGDSLTINTVVPGNLFSVNGITQTGAVSTVSGETLYKIVSPNITNTVSGWLPGLIVSQGNGTPGADGAGWYLRGIGTYAHSGSSNTAKYFVDGFEVNWEYLSYLIPAEISSISVFKDAASLATFGMKGANGVVWIETKRGDVGKMRVNFQVRSGVQKAINIYTPLDSYNFANLYNQAISNDNGRIWTPAYSNEQLEAYKNGAGTNINWYDEVMKNNGYYTDVDLSFRGGSDYVRYNVVLGYSNQQGLFNVSNTDETSNITFNKYSMRTNLDINLLKNVQVSIDMGGRLEDRKRPNYITSTLMNDLAKYPSNIYPVYDALVTDDSSNFSGTTLYPNNPVGSISGLGWKSERLRILQGNFKFKENLDFLLDGLYLQQAFSFYVKSVGTYSKTRNYARYYNGVAQTTEQTSTIVASKLSADVMDEWKQAAFTLGYGNSFGKHEVNSALNFHVSDYKGDGLFGYKYRYMNNNGKINYAYDKRYVAEFGFSYFGSDAYAPGNRWGFYPAVSAAWIVSNEQFLKSSGLLNLLKIRASVGKTGGTDSDETGALSSFDSNGRYLYQQYYTYSMAGTFYQGNAAPFSGQETLAPLFIANQNVFAEKSIKYNIGLDLKLFNKLDFTLDLFMDKRSNILTQDNSLMNYYGRNIQFNNVGKMTNKGFEISALYSDNIDKLNYSLYGMVSYAKNTVDYMAEVPPAYSYNASTGRAYGTRIGLEAIGYYQLSDFNADGSLKNGIPEPMFGTVQPGDLRYKDLNDDMMIDQTDVTEIGNPAYPKWMYSFGGDILYKGFDFSIFFSGSAGASISLLDYSSQTRAFVNNGNASEWAKGAWAYYPEQGIDNRANATYPRLTTQENENNYRASSFWIRKNNFLRIKNLELGYDFCHHFVKRAGISKLRLYMNALNPVTFSNLLKNYDMDPESRYGYPALKSYNVGVQVTF